MSYTIIGETIKSAVSIKLGDIFKVATNQIDSQGNIVYTYPYRYKENITNQRYPNFHIIQVGLMKSNKGIQGIKATTNLINRMQLDYIINVQYRVAADTETISNLQQQLDEVGLKLNTEFNELNLELPTKIYNKNYEKVDGVGQFTFNVRVYANIESEALQMMRNLDIENEMKEEQ